MDIFIEEMVERKKTAGQFLAVLALALVCIGAAFVIFAGVIPAIPQLSSILFLLIALFFYLAYRGAVSMNVEYEYSMVNTEIDVDIIRNRAKRKRLTSLNIKNLEAFGVKGENHEFGKYMSDMSVKKVYACYDKRAEDCYFAVYAEDGMRKMLIFNPSEKIREMIEKLNPKR